MSATRPPEGASITVQARRPAAGGMTETPLTFACGAQTLVGILAEPAKPPAHEHDTAIGVVIVVGGPQYRAGSHRQFVQLARHIAEAGYPVLRFDVRGMGDSGGEMCSFESLDEDILCAIEQLLLFRPSVRRVVLWGLCDGASAALLYCQRSNDGRIAGLVLVNPWVRSATTQAHTLVHHYYIDRLRQPGFWLKLLSGKVALSALRTLWGNIQMARSTVKPDPGTDMSFIVRMALGWRNFPGPLLLLLSGNDFVAHEFLHACETDSAWQGALHRERLTRVDFADVDHTFSGPGHKSAMNQATVDWLAMLAGA